VIQDKITDSKDCPSNDDQKGWVKAARLLDQNRLANEAFHGSGRHLNPSMAPTNPPNLRNSFLRVPPAASLAVGQPSHPFIPLRPPAPPVDASKSPTVTCFRCKQTGHISKDCPLRFDIRYMTTDEHDDLIKTLLASKDAVQDIKAPFEAQNDKAEARKEDFGTNDR
jgi:hypothetical protein